MYTGNFIVNLADWGGSGLNFLYLNQKDVVVCVRILLRAVQNKKNKKLLAEKSNSNMVGLNCKTYISIGNLTYRSSIF